LGGKIRGGLIPPLVICLSPELILLNEIEEDNMTQIKINKMLESTGSNFITLERITLDERAPAEIRRTAFLALNEKNKEYPVQVINQDVESNNLKISLDSNNKLNI
jgi:hypothetical protein